MIAKAILGAVGGALSGAAKGASSNKMSGSSDNSYYNTGKAIGGAIKSYRDKEQSEEGSSDIDLKDVYKDIPDNIIENFARISAIDFNYKPEAQAEYKGESGVDGNEHIGVIAQELEKNPVTAGTVSEDEKGNKVVDTRHLAFADTAAIGELSRRILALESVVMELQQKLR